MIKLRKQQLAFMDMYNLWSNKDQAFQITSDENNLIFSQQSDKGFLITEIPFKVEQIKYNFDTSIFVALIKSLKDDTEIVITEKGIEFSGSKYDIKNYDILFEDINIFLNQVKNNSDEVINLADIDKFQYVKNSIGGEGLNTVVYQSKYFVTSDRNFTSFVKTSFDYKKDFYFSSDLIILFNIMNIKEKDINVYNEFYSCKIDNTYILIMNKNYIIPNMFDENIMQIYNHPFKFEINKQELKTILDRMSIVAKQNKETRIYLELEKDKLNVKNIDSNFACESIEATIDSEIKDIKIPISNFYLSKILNNLSGNIISIYSDVDINSMKVIKIMDENQFNFYVLNLLEG
jgi:hypothetical protein